MAKYLILSFFFFFSCSASQNIVESEREKKPTVNPEIEFKALVSEAQELRDLEFRDVPTLVHVQNIDEVLPSDIVSEYAFLKEVFEFDLESSPKARFSTKGNKIEYVSQFSQKKDEHAIFKTLVTALDAEQNTAVASPKTLNQYLASESRRLSSGAFLSVVRLLKKEQPQLSPERIAFRPESWVKSDIVSSELVTNFKFRNALVFGATMFRSNRIPGIEYGLSSGPMDSGSIKRPDRWLSGEGIGKWTLPKSELPQGYDLSHEGTLGPLFLEKWLGPNPALSFWMSGSYRGYKSENKWLFEWVSMWETPTAASVAAKMLNEGLVNKNKAGATFSVVEYGNIVSVVGSLSGEGDHAARAQTMAKQSQVVFLSEEKPFLNFVPTTFDRLQTLKPQRQGISAPGLLFEESILEGWKIEKPKTGLWWYATLGTEAIIQCNVELKSIAAPFPDDANYGEKWLSVFQSSIGEVSDADVQKLDWNGTPAWEIDLKGKRSEKDVVRRIISRQYAIGEFVVSVSLVTDPKDEKAFQTLTKLFENAKFTNLK